MRISCPSCGAATSAAACEGCGADLSQLRALEVLAETRWAEVWRLIDAGRLEEATQLARQAGVLALDSRARPLLGWLLFMEGDLEGAAQAWEEIPAGAHSVLTEVRSAASLVREGRLEEARERLESVRIPFALAVALRSHLEVPLPADAGEQDEAEIAGGLEPRGSVAERGLPVQASRRPARTGLVAAGLAAVAFAAGWAVRAPQAEHAGYEELQTTEPVGGAPAARDAAIPSPDAGEPRASDQLLIAVLQSLLSPGENLLAGVIPDLVLDGEAAMEVSGVPEAVRARVSRQWYLQGRRLLLSGATAEAESAFLSSVAAVGAQASFYWIDEALFELILLNRAQHPLRAARYARLLLDFHNNSIFNNSVARAAAGIEN